MDNLGPPPAQRRRVEAEPTPNVLNENEVVVSPINNRYEVIKFMKKGNFGEIYKAWKRGTNTNVAIKVVTSQPGFVRQAHIEINVLARLSNVNCDAFNFVRTFEHFHCRSHSCLVLTALMKLRSMKIIHTDIKPGNIMLVDPENQPFRIKIKGFGSAIYRVGAAHATRVLQSRYYRAPEVLLGLPFNEPIDMWSLGCVLAECFLGCPLYPGQSVYDQIRYITETQGTPTDEMLEEATKIFFIKESPEGSRERVWRLRTVPELETSMHNIAMKERRQYIFSSLDDIHTSPPYLATCSPYPYDPTDASCESLEREEFVNLLKRMLTLDPAQRVLPFEAQQHPFVTGSHLAADYKAAVAHANFTDNDASLHARKTSGRLSFCRSTSSGVDLDVVAPVNRKLNNRVNLSRENTPRSMKFTHLQLEQGLNDQFILLLQSSPSKTAELNALIQLLIYDLSTPELRLSNAFVSECVVRTDTGLLRNIPFEFIERYRRNQD